MAFEGTPEAIEQSIEHINKCLEYGEKSPKFVFYLVKFNKNRLYVKRASAYASLKKINEALNDCNLAIQLEVYNYFLILHNFSQIWHIHI